MGHWIGAQIDAGPQACNLIMDAWGMGDAGFIFGSCIPYLHVNINGNRYCNEYFSDYAYPCFSDIPTPEKRHFEVFDADYNKRYAVLPPYGPFSTSPTPEEYLEARGISELNGTALDTIYNLYLETNMIHKADTLEELAKLMDVSPDNLKRTVERVNELAQKGVDEDYSKPAEFLWPIQTPPFYAISRQGFALSGLGGLTVDTSFRVLSREDNEPILGLYACGNGTGGHFFGGLEQPMNIPCVPCARAIMSGRVAIETIQAEQ
jgi:hypothetical protein